MIPIEYYTAFYYAGLTFFAIFFCLELTKYTTLENIPRTIFSMFCLILLTYTICFIGFRDPYGSSLYLGDTGAYTNYFETINERDLFKEKEKGFYFLMKILHPFGVQFFYFFCAVLYVILPYIAFKKLFNKYAILALFLFVFSMSFWGFGINGLRNGLASSIFIYALSCNNKKFLMISIMIISTFFHNSMYLTSFCFLISYYFKNSKILIGYWMIAIIITFFVGEKINEIVQTLVQISGFQDSRTEILNNEIESLEAFRTGFRFDFVLYSAIPIWVGYFYIFKRGFKDIFYIQLYNTYILANTVWVIMMFAPFTNRTAYLSWLLMPLLLIFPLLKSHTIIKNNLKAIIFGFSISLLFALIMQFR